jgi:hypothetical protein
MSWVRLKHIKISGRQWPHTHTHTHTDTHTHTHTHTHTLLVLRRGISWISERLLDSKKGLSSTQWVHSNNSIQFSIEFSFIKMSVRHHNGQLQNWHKIISQTQKNNMMQELTKYTLAKIKTQVNPIKLNHVLKYNNNAIQFSIEFSFIKMPVRQHNGQLQNWHKIITQTQKNNIKQQLRKYIYSYN